MALGQCGPVAHAVTELLAQSEPTLLLLHQLRDSCSAFQQARPAVLCSSPGTHVACNIDLVDAYVLICKPGTSIWIVSVDS